MNNQNYIQRASNEFKRINGYIKIYYEKKLEYDKAKFNSSKSGGLFYKFKHVKDKEFLKNIISKITTEFRKESLMLAKGNAELAKIISIETFSDNRKAYMLVGSTEFSVDYKVDLFNIYYDLVYIFRIITDTILNDDKTVGSVYFFDDKTIESQYIDILIPINMYSGDSGDKINDFEIFNKLSVAYLLKCFEQRRFDLKPYLFIDDYLKLQRLSLNRHGISKFKKIKEKQKRGRGNGKGRGKRRNKKYGGNNDKKRVFESIVQEYNKKIKFGATNLDEFINKRFRQIIENASRDNRLIVECEGGGDGFLVKRTPGHDQLPNNAVNEINEHVLCLDLESETALTGFNSTAILALAQHETLQSRALNNVGKIKSVIIRIKDNKDEYGYNSDNSGSYKIKMSNIKGILMGRVNEDIASWKGQKQKRNINRTKIGNANYDLSKYYYEVNNKIDKIGLISEDVLKDLILLKIAFKKGLISYQSVMDNVDNEYSEQIKHKNKFGEYRTQFLAGLMSMFKHRSEYLEKKIKYFASSFGYSEFDIIGSVIDNVNRKKNNIMKLQALVDKIDKKMYKYNDYMNKKKCYKWELKRRDVLKIIKKLENS